MEYNVSRSMESALEKTLNMIRERGETTTKEVETYLLGLRQRGNRVSLSAPRVIMLLRKRGQIVWSGEKRGKAFVYIPIELEEKVAEPEDYQEDTIEIPRSLFDDLAEKIVIVNRTSYYFIRALGINPDDYPPRRSHN